MNTTTTGREANELIAGGLEINAEIALEEPRCVQGVDEAVLKVISKFGTKAVLEAIQAASWGASEVHEETDDVEDMASFRLRIFAMRLGEAIKALK